MSDIYLHIDGAQTGPYPPAQVRQFLAQGKISAETLAWQEGLSEWKPVAAVLAVFPAPETPVAFGPPPTPKKGMSGGALAALIVAAVFILLFVLPCLAGILVGPITNGIKKARESASMQSTRAIALAMYQYAVDHQGAYPDGKTSTEVFQKLIDGKYVTDPGLFYIAMPGKVRATSTTLTAANVCYDVTSGITADSPDSLPIVFCTGYSVSYFAGMDAMPEASIPFPGPGKGVGGIAVAYKNNSARFIPNDVDNKIPDFIAPGFNPGPKEYRQLRP